jgi:hypothetical protein
MKGAQVWRARRSVVGLGVVATALCLGLACGRVGYDRAGPDAWAPDAGLDASEDARVPLGPFGPPRRLDELFDGTHGVEDPVISADGLELIYASTDAPSGGPNDLWVTTRSARGEMWGTPQPLTEINSAAKDQTPTLSSDDLTLWFSSGRGGGPDDLYVATRATRTSPWSTPVRIAELSTSEEDRGMTVFATDLRTVFNRGPDTAGPFDLFGASRPTADAPWGAPLPVSALNTESDERNAFVTPDGSSMYFASDRGGMGKLDIWLSALELEPDERWGAPLLVTEASVPTANDDDPVCTPDLTIMIFASDRVVGTFALYESVR